MIKYKPNNNLRSVANKFCIFRPNSYNKNSKIYFKKKYHFNKLTIGKKLFIDFKSNWYIFFIFIIKYLYFLTGSLL